VARADGRREGMSRGGEKEKGEPEKENAFAHKAEKITAILGVEKGDGF